MALLRKIGNIGKDIGGLPNIPGMGPLGATPGMIQSATNPRETWDEIRDLGDQFGQNKTGQDAALEAARIQTEYGQKGLDLQKQMYEQGRQDQMPWMQAGQNQLDVMQQGMQSGAYDPGKFEYQPMGEFDFKADPGYQFRLGEGNKQIQAMASAGGTLGGIGTAKELMRYGQGLASDEYGRAHQRYTGDRAFDYGTQYDQYGANRSRLTDKYNRSAGIANTGQMTGAQMAGSANQYANQAASGLQGIGNVQAAGIMGQEAARQQALQNKMDIAGTALGAAGMIGGMPMGGLGGGQQGNVANMPNYSPAYYQNPYTPQNQGLGVA
ncbi:MAG: hypothetical protein GY861_14750 [bacterium]|nr:hypothetical protein [bacterium]